MADWDLGAVVRSFNSATNDQTAPLPPQSQNHLSAPTFPQTTTPNNNFPINAPNNPPAPDMAAFAGLAINPMQHGNVTVFTPPPPPPQVTSLYEAPRSNVLVPSPGYAALQSRPRRVMRVPAPHVPRPRLRRISKNQLKIVCTVSKENLYADMWSWRKYGQKPIKGSPFPRNYYRCSSVKGCTARKLVERSMRNPELFVVTFSGEHGHCRPNHRNSLAGTTRSKSLIYPPPPPDTPPSPLPPPPAPATFIAPPQSIQYLNSVESNTMFVYDDVLIPEFDISDDIFDYVM